MNISGKSWIIHWNDPFFSPATFPGGAGNPPPRQHWDAYGRGILQEMVVSMGKNHEFNSNSSYKVRYKYKYIYICIYIYIYIICFFQIFSKKNNFRISEKQLMLILIFIHFPDIFYWSQDAQATAARMMRRNTIMATPDGVAIVRKVLRKTRRNGGWTRKNGGSSHEITIKYSHSMKFPREYIKYSHYFQLILTLLLVKSLLLHMIWTICGKPNAINHPIQFNHDFIMNISPFLDSDIPNAKHIFWGMVYRWVCHVTFWLFVTSPWYRWPISRWFTY